MATGIFIDAATGETIERELTAEEIESLESKMTDEQLNDLARQKRRAEFISEAADRLERADHTFRTLDWLP